MTVASLDGPVTPEEVAGFKAYMKTVELPTSNKGNGMVYGSGGAAAQACVLMYEATHDPEILDQLVRVTDQMLAARNDEKTGRVLWTGKRDPVWPNKAEDTDDAKSAGTENGDVVGHIASAAEMILRSKELWDKKVGIGDAHHFGETYLERAKTYVRELDHTMDVFIVPYFVQEKNQLRTPVSALYSTLGDRADRSRGKPVPWNQQAMLCHGFQRLAVCHEMLGDDPERVKKYDAVVQASVDWFFSEVTKYQVDGHDCYKWSYPPEDKILHYVEDTAHGGYDVLLLYRAYKSGRYGITPEMMKPLANTCEFVMYKGDHQFATRTDGQKDVRKSIGATWLSLSEFNPTLYGEIAETDIPQVKDKPLVTAYILFFKDQRFKNPQNIAAKK